MQNVLAAHSLSLSDRALRDTFMMKTDDLLEQFANAFSMLKNHFHDHLNIDSWKIARSTKDGIVQLVTNTEHLKDMGEVQSQCRIKLKTSCSHYSRGQAIGGPPQC
jgi:hypothetical protein